MDYKLQVLSIQQTNWPAFIETYQELFGASPTRVLDQKNIALDKPVAYQTAITEHFNGYLDAHINISMVGTANADMMLDIQRKTMLSLISKESSEERGLYIFIVTGNLGAWKHASLVLSDGGRHIKQFCTQCQSFIKMAGYKL